MPVKTSGNNRVLPPNARASDVAANAIQQILPQQQLKTYSAFRVQGYQCVVYNRLTQGRKCTCQASQKILGSRLSEDGKAKPGTINELLTGSTVFNVTPYGVERTPDPFSNETSPLAPVDKNQGVFDVVGSEPLSAPTHMSAEASFGDNGPYDPMIDLEALANDFDASSLGLTDAHCAVCFGSGFVGGYAPLNANRIVLTVDDVELGESIIDPSAKPWRATGERFKFKVVLPHGALGIDTFRVMNNNKQVAANFIIDERSATSSKILSYCNGRQHEIEVYLPREHTWTHLELQFALSKESAYFEFPKLSKSSDTAMLEQLEPFSILISSNVPNLATQDIITDSVFGKTLIVQNTSWSNTRNRNILGWECQVRVLQPQELFNILPKRGRIMTKPPTNMLARDNQTGNRRT